MKKQIKIENKTYTIQPIPPSLTPLATLAAKLLTKEPQTVEDAEEIGQQLQTIIQKLLAGTVTPKQIAPEHTTQLYGAVSRLTEQVVEAAGFLPKAKTQQSKKPDS